jgi:hypothetical protein
MQRQLHTLQNGAPSTLPSLWSCYKGIDSCCMLCSAHLNILVNDGQRDSAVEENESRVALTYTELVWELDRNTVKVLTSTRQSLDPLSVNLGDLFIVEPPPLAVFLLPLASDRVLGTLFLDK